jgi:predicted transposase YdaD
LAKCGESAVGITLAARSAVPYCDRAFRALVRDQPDVLISLLDAVVRPRLALEGPITAEDVDDTHVDLPPSLDADSVARCSGVVLHTECQGYRDPSFDERVFRYHLLLPLRYPALRVETIALSLRRPAKTQRRGVIVRGNVTVKVHVVVLPEISAEKLLADPRTACFAPCAHASGMSVEELCARVARTLRAVRDRGTGRELHMAVVAAAVRQKYHQMIEAMEAAKVEPVVIEDLVEIGRDMGLETGRAEGIETGRAEGIEAARAMLLETIVVRGLSITDAQRERISRERLLERLREWHRGALHADSMAAVLGE